MTSNDAPAPAGNGPRIGVAVTVRGDAGDAVREIRRCTPGARVVVVDNGSADPVPGADHRFDVAVGTAPAKNKCLELLAGCDHIFLFEPGCVPLIEGWHQPYVDSREPHLSFVPPGGPARILYQDSRHVAWTADPGIMIYVDRSVLDTVGGLDPDSPWPIADWSRRTNNAGLTTWLCGDVVDSGRLLSGTGAGESLPGRAPDLDRYLAEWSDRHYVEFRQLRDLIITTLFTGQDDPQRKGPMLNDPSMYAELAGSLDGHKLVVLHDRLTAESTDVVELVQVEAPMNPYLQRWISIWHYLQDHPEIGRVWCVDATDVELLREPFSIIRPGTLYVGSEPVVVGMDWIRRKHPAALIQEFIERNFDRQLLNAGLVGGHREIVMEFTAAITRAFFENRRDQLHGTDVEPGTGDIGLFNLTTRTMFGDRLFFGPRINTTFRQNERNAWSIWRHK
ncbi:MAG TPA: hypothetical protein VHC49_13835 [Mycobacteriales bacterium]|nr:hypothetical protein [Mycobacteriales bacterium]